MRRCKERTRGWGARLRWRLAVPSAALVVMGVLLVAVLEGCAPSASASGALRGTITIAGSTALQPLVTKAAARFESQHPGAHIVVSGGGSLFGIKSVTSHKVTIGDSDVYADPAAYPDPTLTDHLVAVIPFTMIVNPDVTGVTTLTRNQIIGVFSTGQFTNWSQVGGPDLPIVPVVRPPTSGTRLIFRTYVMGGRDEKGIAIKTDSSQTVLTTVAQTSGAIGYAGLSVLDKTVKTLAIDGVAASPKAIESGRYPFWGYEHMYTLGDNNPLANAFLDYMLTPEIQSLAQQMGYIPVSQMHVAEHVGPQRADGATIRDVRRGGEAQHE